MGSQPIRPFHPSHSGRRRTGAPLGEGPPGEGREVVVVVRGLVGRRGGAEHRASVGPGAMYLPLPEVAVVSVTVVEGLLALAVALPLQELARVSDAADGEKIQQEGMAS
jgi:hypothetical protein